MRKLTILELFFCSKSSETSKKSISGGSQNLRRGWSLWGGQVEIALNFLTLHLMNIWEFEPNLATNRTPEGSQALNAIQAPLLLKFGLTLKSIISMLQIILSKKEKFLVQKRFLDLKNWKIKRLENVQKLPRRLSAERRGLGSVWENPYVRTTTKFF